MDGRRCSNPELAGALLSLLMRSDPDRFAAPPAVLRRGRFLVHKRRVEARIVKLIGDNPVVRRIKARHDCVVIGKCIGRK